MTDLDRDAAKTVARAARAAMRRIWAQRDERDTLERPERELLLLMEEHKEFRPFWEGAEPSDEENPFIHVTMHRMVDEQIEKDDPRGTRAAFERQVERGEDPHEAKHAIMSLWVIEVARRLEEKKPVDLDAYRAKLDQL
jgi:hypothetical protein